MDPASAIVYVIVQDFALSFVSSLLANYVARPTDDPRTKRDRGRAEEALADVVTDSLLPLFPPGMPEPDAKLVAGRLEQASKRLSVELLAECEYHTVRVMAAIAAPADDTQDARFQHLDGLFRKGLQTVVERYIQVAPSLPEWQRMNWNRNFDILRRVDENTQEIRAILEEMRDKPWQETHTFEQAFRKSVAAKNSHARLLGVPAPMPVELHLDAAFVELQLSDLQESEPDSDAADACEIATLKEMRDRVERQIMAMSEGAGASAGAFLAQHPRLVVVGAPGSGKTTLLQRLAYCAAEGRLDEWCPGVAPNLLPLLFRVRSLDLQNLPSPEEFIHHLAPNLAAAYPAGFFTRLLSDGRALVMVDGLDECEAGHHRCIMEWIAGLTRDFGKSRYLLCSRPAGYTRGELDGCAYTEAELQPLTVPQRDDFVERWYRAAASATGGIPSERDLGDSAADLIARLSRTPSIRSMATNPLLLAVICVVHRYRGERVPERRSDLLKHCVDVLIHEWSSAKTDMPHSLLTELDATQKSALVRPLAWRMMLDGVAEAPRATVEEVFAGVLPTLGQEPGRADELLDHIRDESGLLVEQRPGVFSFAHLVFQEYLAAEAALGIPNGPDALLDHAGDSQWSEVLQLYCALQGASPRSLILALLESDELIRAGQCAGSVVALDSDVRDKVVSSLLAHIADDHRTVATLTGIADPSLYGRCLELILANPISAHELFSRHVCSAVRAIANTQRERDVKSSAVLILARLSKVVAAAQRASGALGAWSASFAARMVVLAAMFEWEVRVSGDGVTFRSRCDSPRGPQGDTAPLGFTYCAAGNSATGVDSGKWDSTFLLEGCGSGPADVCAALAAALETLEPGVHGASLRATVLEGELTAEQRAYLWGPLAETIDRSEAPTALAAIGGLCHSTFPLLRLCVLRRLEHRWDGQIGEAEKARLDELIKLAESDVEAHYRAVAERVAEGTSVTGLTIRPG